MSQPVTDVTGLPTLTAPTPDLPFDPAADVGAEFDRQVAAYEALGVTALLGLAPGGLARWVAPLRTAVTADPPPPAPGAETRDDDVALVLVLGADPNDVVPAMRRGARAGVSVIGREELAGYRATVDLPAFPYLMTSVDVGSDFLSVTPEAAVTEIRGRGRTGLTIAEGVALAVTRPDRLRPGRCWSLASSRAGNQRVPAVWISDRRAKLGWCWDRNPHTWLGAASAGGRLGIRGGAAPGGR